MALADVLRNMTIYIEEEQLLAGNQASSNRAAPLFPEYAFAYILDELDDLEKEAVTNSLLRRKIKSIKRNSSVVGRKNIKRQSYCHAAAGSVG